uniref:Claspin-like protein n=1 Tax=Schistosoma mansoni TaxID=6183 RepID=A0A3Q0KLC1_SCHMA
MLDSLSSTGGNLSPIEASNAKEIVPESNVEKSYILPPDLVDNELSDECDNNVDSPPSNQIHSSDENNELWTIKDDIEETEEKVGRWTLSSGASKNVSKIKSSARNKKHSKPTNMEEERLQIYSESQRLVREADVHLPVHRPKQFKCFSEFRQSLKGCKSNETKSCETSSQNKLHSDCSTHFQPIPGQSTRNEETENELDIKPFVSQGYSIDHPVDIDCTTLEPPPMSSDAKPSLDVTSEPDVLTNLLPRLDARKLKNDEREELFIDLGESIPTSTSSVTPSQLLARLKSHLHVSHEKVVRGPIQYSIITKVQSSDAEREELQVETVTHEPSKGLSTTISVSRKHWLEHRKVLEEKMRQKRLEQYEMRLKEEGTCLKSTNENTGEVSNSDEEWSEGVANDSEISDEDSNAEEESSSDSESEEEEGEENESLDDDEEDDNVVVGSKKASRQRPCLFADDEAEESENDEVFAEADDPEDEEALTCKDCADIKQNKSCSKTTGVNNLNVDFGKNIARSHTPQKQHLQLDDFTDLPQETTGFKLFSSCNNGYSLGLPQRHHHGTLGPADIDLFASECSSILDRTMNPQSILASTRLDATTIGDENKSRFTRNSSTHSQWNNTPYELLYSQKPNSQLLASRSESITQEFIDDNRIMTSNPHNVSSQDTVLLSQEPTQPTSQLDPTIIISEETNSSLQSQVLHKNHRQLFSESVSDQSGLFTGILTKSNVESSNADSQVHHENRHNLFGGSLCDESQAVMDSVTTKSFDENDDIDSQVRHNDRCNLFGGSISNQSQELVDGTAKSITGGYVTDSQTNHDNHRILFGGSISTQSQAFMDLAGDNDDLDSQIQHEKHGNLFSGSICVQSQESINEVKNSIINNNPDSHENRRNLFGESTCDQSQGHVDEILKSPVNNHDDPDFQESEHPISGFTTQNSSRRRVLVFDDEDDEEEGNKEKKDNSFIEPSSLIRNNPFKSTSESNFTSDNLSEVFHTDDNVELEDKISTVDESDDHTIEAGDDEANIDPDDITDEDNGSDNESSEGDEEEEKDNSLEDEDDEEEIQRLTIQSNEIKKTKKFRINDFVDEEAELSGDENERAYFMDDEDELDPNDDDANEEFADLIDEDDSDIPSAGRLRRQIERVHHRLQTDQDLRELRYLKELYFEDGDLHAENGRVRQRRFRWRGLDNNDPFTDQINIDNSDDNSSEDEKHGIPCGPIDNWLRRGPMKSSNGENNQSTENGDLDSDTIHSSSNKQTNDKDPSDSALESDEEIENSKAVTDNLSTGVLSLGKKALLKSQTKLQTQIVVCNKLPSNRGKTTKSASTLRNPLFSNYFLQPKSHNLPINEGVTNDTDSNSKVDSVIVSTNNNDKPIAPVKFNNVNNAVNDVRFQTIRRGSLLSRFAGGLVPGYKSEPTQIHSNVNDGFDAGTSKSESRRDQTHLDLRSKVGLSCFSVVTAQIKPEKTDSFDDGASNQKSLKSCDFPIKQKRPVDVIKPNSVLLSPPSLKRHRSTSVFNALL